MEISDLLESIDIVAYISQFVDLEERGSEWWGLSPFKTENTPSFSVRKETGTFYCFSSGIGGNVITFVKYYFKCSAYEAVSKLKEWAGIDGEVNIRRPLACTQTANRFRTRKTGKPARKSSNHRAMRQDYMDRFEINEDKLAVWEREGISRQVLDEFQVRYDAFSNRLVYPIRDIDGNIVNIGGRTLDPDWKEKKQRKYTYFSGWDGGINLIYGLWENRKAIEQGEIIVFEGVKSVMLAKTYGISNAVCLLTSHLSDAQMKILIKIGKRTVFALDKDVQIRNDRNIQRLKQFVTVEYICDRSDMLGEKDSPIDKGPEVFRTLYEKRLVWR